MISFLSGRFADSIRRRKQALPQLHRYGWNGCSVDWINETPTGTRKELVGGASPRESKTAPEPTRSQFKQLKLGHFAAQTARPIRQLPLIQALLLEKLS
jgi:hypothetical protein